VYVASKPGGGVFSRLLLVKLAHTFNKLFQGLAGNGQTTWMKSLSTMSLPERAGSKRVQGNDRMYHISFHADDGKGAACSGTVRAGVPHDQGKHSILVDGGPKYDSTALTP
jgi:hypothetical protein